MSALKTLRDAGIGLLGKLFSVARPPRPKLDPVLDALETEKAAQKAAAERKRAKRGN